jgi:hypothetical protein
MMQLSNLSHTTKVWQQLKIACYVLLALITLQSTFAVADTCVPNLSHNGIGEHQLDNITANETANVSTLNSAHNSELSSTKILAKKVLGEQSDTDEECFDCDCKCCPCCSNIMFPLSVVNKDIAVPEPALFIFASLPISSLYDSLKRPPKH